MFDPVTVSINLPALPGSAAVARHVIRSLAPLVDRNCLNSTELVISEIVTNSIRHGSTDGRDRVGIEIVASANQLTGKVRDNGPPFEPRFDLPDAEHVGGYGLHIAQSLSTLTVSRTATGNIVTFTVS